MNYYIETFGCQMNYSDSERIESLLEDIGYYKVKKQDNADLIIYNSCSVRQKAEDKVLGKMKEIKKLRKIKPKLIVAITGCMVRKSSTRNFLKRDKLFSASKIVDLCFKIEDLLELPGLIKEALLEKKEDKKQSARNGDADSRFNTEIETLHERQKAASLRSATVHKNDNRKGGNSDTLEDYFKINPKYNSKFQAFLPIMTGCNNFCAYCIVPYSRGREKSRPMSEIVREAEKMVKSGIKEITLLGQNVNSYNPVDFSTPLPSVAPVEMTKLAPLDIRLEMTEQDSVEMTGKITPPFVLLLEEIDKLKKFGLKRLCFTSSHPKDMSDELIRAVGSLKTLCNHIHLPVQSGDNEVLKNMNRNYSREHYLELIKKIRKTIPDCAISTDIIVGFPSETDKQFENSYKLFEEVEFDMAYLARYSPRKGTLSAEKMEDNVPKEEKARRWHKLNNLLKKIAFKKNKECIGTIQEVLIEKYENGFLTGRTRSYKEALFKGKKELVGEIVQVKIEDARGWVLLGKIF